MTLLDNANVCVEAVTVLGTLPDTPVSRAAAAVLSTFIERNQPIEWEEPIMALARALVTA